MTRSSSFLLFLFCMISSPTFSQGDTLAYKLKTKKPELSFVGLEIPLMDLGVNSYNPYLGTGVHLTGNYKGFHLRGGYDIAYWSRMVADPIGTPTNSINKERPSQQWNALIGYTFSSKKTEERSLNVTLDVEGGNFVDTAWVIEMDARSKIKYAAEAGYHTGFMQYRFTDTRLFDMEVKGRKVTSSENGPVETIAYQGIDKQLSSMMDYGFISIGASRIKVTNVVGLFERFGEKSRRNFERFYAHVLISTSNSVDDVFFPVAENRSVSKTADGPFNRYTIDEHTPKALFGARVGYRKNTPGKVAINYGAELGSFPGRGGFLNDLYLRLRFDLAFSKVF